MSSTTRLHVLAVGLHHRQLVILKKKYCKHPTELQDSAHCTVYCFITRESICLGFSYPICEVEGSQRGGAGDPEPVGFAVRIPFHNTGTHVLCAYKKKDVPLSAGAVWRGLGQQRREVLDAAGALPSNTPTNRAVVMRRPATSGVSGVLTSRAGLVTIVTRVHSRCLTKCMSQK